MPAGRPVRRRRRGHVRDSVAGHAPGELQRRRRGGQRRLRSERLPRADRRTGAAGSGLLAARGRAAGRRDHGDGRERVRGRGLRADRRDLRRRNHRRHHGVPGVRGLVRDRGGGGGVPARARRGGLRARLRAEGLWRRRVRRHLRRVRPGTGLQRGRRVRSPGRADVRGGDHDRRAAVHDVRDDGRRRRRAGVRVRRLSARGGRLGRGGPGPDLPARRRGDRNVRRGTGRELPRDGVRARRLRGSRIVSDRAGGRRAPGGAGRSDGRRHGVDRGGRRGRRQRGVL